MSGETTTFPLLGPLLGGHVPDGTSFVVLFDADWEAKERLVLYIFENMSDVVAASDERTFLKFYQRWTSRLVALGRVTIEDFVRGVHSESFVNSVVAGAHSIVELRVEEIDGELVDVLRVRAFRGRRVDSRRHVVRFDEALRPTLSLAPTAASARSHP